MPLPVHAARCLHIFADLCSMVWTVHALCRRSTYGLTLREHQGVSNGLER